MNDLVIPQDVAKAGGDDAAAEDAATQATYGARTRWIEGAKFLGETASGHALVMEGAAGDNLGVRPMELFLLGLGGCSAVDVVWLLRGMGEDVTDCDIRIEGKRATTHPQVFTHIHARYVVVGRGLNPMKVKLALKMSKDRLCSASAMLGKVAEMTHELEIKAA